MKKTEMLIAFCLCLLTTRLVAAEGDSLIVAFSDPSKPGTVKAELYAGSIAVHVHNSPDVLIVTRDFGDDDSTTQRVAGKNIDLTQKLKTAFDRLNHESQPGFQFDKEPDPDKIKGLKKVQSSPFGINVEEEDNVIVINLPPMAMTRSGQDLLLLVPARTSLQLKSFGGNITVQKVSGKIELEAFGGDITLKSISGAVVAHTMGNITADIRAVDAGSPMSFSTFGGDIDVTLPASITATLVLNSHGDIYTDFDTSKRRQTRKVKESDAEDRFEMDVQEVLEIPLNGGGPEIEFANFTGNIYVRKGH